MDKYKILINILDQIIKSAPIEYSKKYPQKSENLNVEQLNQARARAYIHLYLLVSFGILDFKEREHFISDGSYDGGIDAYYIDNITQTVFLIQSKFRNNDSNFENKEISLEEILKMDINEILDGENQDEDGNEYNGKVKQLQREISNVENIGRYSYQVIILANLNNIGRKDLIKITGGYNTKIINHQNCYNELVFPVITGTFYKASDLSINIDLSNKNAGSKISYTVQTNKGESEITVLFIPTLELARIMYKYKNSILKFNPRSYLGHEGKNVNNSIRETILDNKTNEFALFNNGVTMLSDETYINEKIGQKNKAQLIVKNPQIINGGQTSFTLSKIYEENISGNLDDIFQGKEVLLKVITLLGKNNHQDKVELINSISNATNQQTPVINADRLANDQFQVDLQNIIFETFGYLYERKRGEFSDGIYNNYITENKIIERNLLFKMYNCVNSSINKARQKKLIFSHNESTVEMQKDRKLEKSIFAFLVFRKISRSKIPNLKFDHITYAKIKVMTELYLPDNINNFEEIVDKNYDTFSFKWDKFIHEYKIKSGIEKGVYDSKTGYFKDKFKVNYVAWFGSANFENEYIEYFT
ncbi:AIPR family protein [Flavobacterium sp.]|uniref:AIPR family protein n=1 Tax=Flavobacterium sp. TaxID=239 RepID=UPI002603642F|nr:AIPR family protein [Flavobacterium sp.]